MPTIKDAFINAMLADASYVSGLGLAQTPGDLIDTLTGRMTSDLAKLVGDNFTVLTQVESAGSSFDAVLSSGSDALCGNEGSDRMHAGAIVESQPAVDLARRSPAAPAHAIVAVLRSRRGLTQRSKPTAAHAVARSTWLRQSEGVFECAA